MVEQGWTALAVPEDRGGLGLGIVELALLLEEVGGHVAPAPCCSRRWRWTHWWPGTDRPS